MFKLSRQAAFCGFLFHELQSHSKAGMWETYLIPKTLYTFKPQSDQEVIFVLLAKYLFQMLIAAAAACTRGCRDRGWKGVEGMGILGHMAEMLTTLPQLYGKENGHLLYSWRWNRLQVRWWISPVSRHPKYPYLLAHPQMKINLQLHARAMFTAPAHSHLCLLTPDRNSA